ncbi:uncharacterized protein LOC122643014 [Telopea speciosissima]|uniref:uncharacterized protein LOC122643014 n=1 Tax=Telopea speciosissima TaxID=54955 RepID=UPI001CC63343|nr:uncharacterized protein LOC122643014 [Telopea speciosissima]
MRGLSKLGTGLTVVFVVGLLLLLAEVFYVVWYRRRFRRRSATVESEASGEPYTTTDTNHYNTFSSKELMYLFCWNNQSRIEPASPPTAPSMDQEDISSESDNPLKWHVLYGQSRLLFTIKEEEKEDLESEKSSSAERKPNPENRRVSLSECFERAQEELPVETESTPFSTPCASPPYYTPSPSPTRDAGEECFVSLHVTGC